MIALYGGGNVSTCGFSSGGALPDFEAACKRANVPYTAFARPKMGHCYCMLPVFQEAKEDFAKMRMTKSDNDTIGVMVTGTPVPSLKNILRTYLNSSKRNVRPDKYVSVLSRSDIRIYICGKVCLVFRFLRCSTGVCEKCQAYRYA